MSPETKKLLVKFAAYVDEIARRFNAMKEKQAFTAKVASYRIPEVVDLLVKKGLANKGDERLLAESLKDHAKCLLYIEKLANYARPGSFGSVVYGGGSDVKPSFRPIGQVLNEDETVAGRNFKEAFLRLNLS